MLKRKSERKNIEIIIDRCLYCGVCEAVCPNLAITVFPARIELQKDKCIGCDLCIGACPMGAIR
jgi:formate hydrogenlyase subunit 6/NADH:ubiquinone oxidoreductase subunit I